MTKLRLYLFEDWYANYKVRVAAILAESQEEAEKVYTERHGKFEAPTVQTVPAERGQIVDLRIEE